MILAEIQTLFLLLTIFSETKESYFNNVKWKRQAITVWVTCPDQSINRHIFSYHKGRAQIKLLTRLPFFTALAWIYAVAYLLFTTQYILYNRSKEQNKKYVCVETMQTVKHVIMNTTHFTMRTLVYSLWQTKEGWPPR